MDVDNPSAETDASNKTKKLTLSFEEYKSLSNMLVMHMRRQESRMELEGTFISNNKTISTILIFTLEYLFYEFKYYSVHNNNSNYN